MTAAPPPYAELACASAFSFLEGASKPDELFERAFTLGHAGLAVTDRNTLAGVVRPWSLIKDLKRRAKADGAGEVVSALERFRYVVGTRLVFADGAPDVLAYPLHREGYGRLCRLLSTGNLRAKKGECRLELADLLRVGEGLALALVPPARPDPEALRPVLDALTDAHGGFVWLAAAAGYGAVDARRLDLLAELAGAAGAPLLACNDVLYHHPERRRLQNVMTAIREHTTVREAGARLQANGERHLKPATEMARLFRHHPGALDQVALLLDLCQFDLGQLKYEYPREPIPPHTTPQAHLEDLCWKGLRWRYGETPPEKVVEQMKTEFAFIAKKAFAHYFLTVHDIVRFARARGILCQGRGSAANSVVCFALGVTAVDPNVHKLLFARFLSEERDEPPDIDIDFEHERREDVIQDIYVRYGRARAALCATVIHFRPRSALREVGKALGLTDDVTAALAGMVWGSWGKEPNPDHVRQVGLDPDNPQIRETLALAGQLLEFPRHLSQHVGGFVLTQDRIDETVPVLNGAMEGRTFLEWDKDDIDALEIMKVDVLALGMLSAIRRAFGMLNGYGIHPIADMAEIEANQDDNPAVYDMLGRGDTVGVFQVESRAQMNMLPRLKPREFYDLAIEVAIVRPGPIQGDMVHPYLRRKQGLDPVQYAGPSPEHGEEDELENVLKRTLGVPLFQEQAMQMAMVAAEFTDVEADGLRRAMATFRRTGGVTGYHERMVGRMVERGYPQDYAERCFKQIEGFGSYGFPESHAISFAKLVYVSAWIKCYHPGVFCASLLNAQPMGFYAPAQIVRDAREHGVEVRPPDVGFSDWDCTLEPAEEGGWAVRLGLRQIDGLQRALVEAMTLKSLLPCEAGEGDHAKRGGGGVPGAEVEGRVAPLTTLRAVPSPRSAGGEKSRFADFDDLVRRSGLPASQLQILAQADAMRSLGLDRRAALWRVRGLSGAKPAPLLAPLPDPEAPVELPHMALSEHVVADYQTTRLSLKGHPMGFLRAGFTAARVIRCSEVAGLKDGAPVSTAGVVLVRQRPGTGVVCFITVEDETGVANLVVLPKVFERYRKEIMSARLLEAHGRIQKTTQAEEVVHVCVERLVDRSDRLRELSEPQFELKHLLAWGDEVVKNGPGGSDRRNHYPNKPEPPQLAVHPRGVRVIPPSRDFH
jgi:error-prone DNA polymerase